LLINYLSAAKIGNYFITSKLFANYFKKKSKLLDSSLLPGSSIKSRMRDAWEDDGRMERFILPCSIALHIGISALHGTMGG
jgi:hypothetical protein